MGAARAAAISIASEELEKTDAGADRGVDGTVGSEAEVLGGSASIAGTAVLSMAATEGPFEPNAPRSS